jgi:hypothetical protein
VARPDRGQRTSSGPGMPSVWSVRDGNTADDERIPS